MNARQPASHDIPGPHPRHSRVGGNLPQHAKTPFAHIPLLTYSTPACCHTPMKAKAVNDTLQRRAAPPVSESPKPNFKVVPIHSGFAPGVDPIKLNQLDDQLQAEEFIRRVKG